jgi:UDP-GlcNAc3NAcA epimerase
MIKILTVLGARPQFIKAATVSRAIAVSEGIKEVIVHTGQHFDANMSDIFFEQLDIPRAHYNLKISGLSHGAMTGRMLEAIESLIVSEKPTCILVYGDTNSTLAAALAGVKKQVPVAHVEAGLRSSNPTMPEEINRVLTDRVSSTLFCPTRAAVENLTLEGYPFACVGNNVTGSVQKISEVGDVMYDASVYYRTRVEAEISLEQFGLRHKDYVLCTLHRQENTDDLARLEGIVQSINKIASHVKVVLPLHPRTRAALKKLAPDSISGSVELVPPAPYLEMQRLLSGAKVLLTDSGGMQKEAYFYDVPCVTLRDETEWVETVAMGCNVLVSADVDRIFKAWELAMCTTLDRSKANSPYGNGQAARQIVDCLKESIQP